MDSFESSKQHTEKKYYTVFPQVITRCMEIIFWGYIIFSFSLVYLSLTFKVVIVEIEK